MIEPLKMVPMRVEGSIVYTEPTIREIREKINDIIWHINIIEGAFECLVSPEEENDTD